MKTMLTIFAALVASIGPSWCEDAAVMELKPGDAAPPFTMKGSDGKDHKLSDSTGKRAVVLAWFPKAFTGGCTAECKSMHENGNEIAAFDVAYFTASVDAADVNKDFAASVGADYPILSDPDKKVAGAYGVLTPDGQYARRWTFYIGADGKILFIDKAVKPPTAGHDVAAKLGELGIPKKKEK